MTTVDRLTDFAYPRHGAREFPSAEVRDNPYPFYRALRAEGPVHPIAGTSAFIVSRYADVSEVIRRTDDFVMVRRKRVDDPELATIAVAGWPEGFTLIFTDPPEHTRYRQLLRREFTPRQIALSEPFVREIVVGLVEEFESSGEADLVTQLAIPMPLAVISGLLGFARADLPALHRWVDANMAAVDYLGMIPREQMLSSARSRVEMQQYFAREIEDRAIAPRDDMLSSLVGAGAQADPPLDMAELVDMTRTLFVAAYETTIDGISRTLQQLLLHPDQLELVRRDRSLIPAAAEEGLRFEAPLTFAERTVAKDTTLAGTSLPAGAKLLLALGCANRDETAFARPAEFDITRSDAVRHMSFGHGIHFCLGAALARLEIVVALEELIARLPGLRLSADNDFRLDEAAVTRGLRHLRVEWDTQ